MDYWIKGYESLCSVTLDGDVLSHGHSLPLALSQSNIGSGYLKVRLHKLMAGTSLPNPEGHPEINHGDDDEKNCSVDNLEWITHTKNIEHAHRTGLISSTKLNPEIVLQIYTSKERSRKLARRYGVCRNYVVQIRNGRRWSSITGHS